MATRFQHHSATSPHPTSQFFNDDFQQGLARWNRNRLAPGFPGLGWEKDVDEEARMRRLEGAFLETWRADVARRAAEAPTDTDAFLGWFSDLQQTGPGQGHPLFPWLESEASASDFRWFLQQEAAGEAGFDDLVAMTQVKVPNSAKLELANNYWDEMGRGNPKGIHGTMLDGLVEHMEIDPTIETTVWESLALANAMTAMAANRRYAWHAVGALGVIELTAPGRSRATADGLKRLGFDGKARRYFELHAVLDVKHSEDWNEKVIRPLVDEDPRRATAMAEGALIRLDAGARCFDRYWAHFQRERP